MPLPVIADVFRCSFEWTNSDTGLSATNVMHFANSGATPADIAADIDASVTATMWSPCDNHSHVREIDITPLDGTSVTFPFVTGSGAKYSGQQTSHSIVPQACSLIKLLTAKRGRSYRGRVYIPWTSEDGMTNGHTDPANVAILNTAWHDFWTAMSAAGSPLVIASYKLATAENVIASVCETFLATQRKRNARTSA